MSLLCSRAAAAVVVAATLAFSLPASWPAQAAAPAPASHKAFILIEYQVRDRTLFEHLREKVRESLKSYGGDVVTREKVDPIFGGNPTNLSVISFPNVEAARKWLASKDVAAVQPDRDKAAKVTTYLVERLD